MSQMSSRTPWVPDQDDYPHAAIQAERRRRQIAHLVAQDNAAAITPLSQGGLLLQAVVTFASKTDEGQVIEAVAVPWFQIVDLMHRDPSAINQMDWRKWEELIAGAYEQAGFDEVILTPRSNDNGRDIIASRRGIGSVRFIDQVKAYAPGNLVKADDVRALIGVLTLDGNVSKGILTTTSDFAPGVKTDPQIAALMPYRLELKNRDTLMEWLDSLAKAR
jgi:restriction system protein